MSVIASFRESFILALDDCRDCQEQEVMDDETVPQDVSPVAFGQITTFLPSHFHEELDIYLIKI